MYPVHDAHRSDYRLTISKSSQKGTTVNDQSILALNGSGIGGSVADSEQDYAALRRRDEHGPAATRLGKVRTHAKTHLVNVNARHQGGKLKSSDMIETPGARG